MRGFRKRKKVPMDSVDITSLLDILIILLVFLLKSYNPNSFKTHIVSSLETPSLKSYTKGEEKVSIQVNNKRSVFINKMLLGSLNDEKIEEKIKISLLNKGKEKFKDINIIVDKSVVYKELKIILAIVKDIGIKKMRFVVRGG